MTNNQKVLLAVLIGLLSVKFLLIPLGESVANAKDEYSRLAEVQAKTNRLVETKPEADSKFEQANAILTKVNDKLGAKETETRFELKIQKLLETDIETHKTVMRRFVWQANESTDSAIVKKKALIAVRGHLYDVIRLHQAFSAHAPLIKIKGLSLNSIRHSNGNIGNVDANISLEVLYLGEVSDD